MQHFMRTLSIRTYDELRQVDHRAVIACERIMREIDGAAPSTVRRRLAALSSLFKHLVCHNHVETNPVSEVERPAINRREGSTLAFPKDQARRLLDLPDETTVEGLRDRAILTAMQLHTRLPVARIPPSSLLPPLWPCSQTPVGHFPRIR
jgi:site-specific recombinase XerD